MGVALSRRLRLVRKNHPQSSEATDEAEHSKKIQKHVQTQSSEVTDEAEHSEKIQKHVQTPAKAPGASGQNEHLKDIAFYDPSQSPDATDQTEHSTDMQMHDLNRNEVEESTAERLPQCPCCKYESTSLFKYYMDHFKCIGVRCIKCGAEFIKTGYCHEAKSVQRNKTIRSENEEFFLYSKVWENPQVLKHTPVESFEQLSNGDHVAWLRGTSILPYEHHAVVIKVGDGPEIVHFNPAGRGEFEVITGTLKAEHLKDMVKCHHEYADKRELIVARAVSWLGDRGYDLIKNNCEHFATLCIQGTGESNQISRFNTMLVSSTIPKISSKLKIVSRLKNLKTIN